MNNIDRSKTVRTDTMRGDSERDTELLTQMLSEAKAFLETFDWCKSITESYFGIGIGGVVAVFLFRIIPAARNVDEWLWVVVGDLPPAYLVVDDNPTPRSALEAYVEEMTAWADAAQRGEPTDELIPVNVTANPENANQLRKRLSFLTETVIPMYSAR